MKQATFFLVLAAPLVVSVAWPEASFAKTRLWEVQSIDTVKSSRDLARQTLTDPKREADIEVEVKSIADLGATHVAIGTPYDQEFLPVLEKWVAAARRHNLSVWFRGNFAGWEGWFGYPRITRGEHLVKTEEFILTHPDLFRDGDIFTSCTECENGGPGDPRANGDLKGHRQFLMDEYWVTKNAFAKIDKAVKSNYFSMNGGVARLVMDEATTRALDGIVTIDHYVKSPEQLALDVREIARRSGGRVVLGEFGAPIPDIHGQMTELEQAQWLQRALAALAQTEELMGLNYWVGFGGSTALWRESREARVGVAVLEHFYKPPLVSGMVKDELNRPVEEARIEGDHRVATPDRQGRFELPFLENKNTELKVTAKGYADQAVVVTGTPEALEITLQKKETGFWFRLLLSSNHWFQQITDKLARRP